MLLDIDAFKAYNDRLGHQAGDACLRAVAQAVAQAHRRAGELVARYGGEEWAVILPGVSPEGALAVAERACASASSSWVSRTRRRPVALVVTVSVGAASAQPALGGVPADLVAAADRALYRAKEGGRNRAELGKDVSLEAGAR